MNLDDMLKEASIIDHSWWTSEGGLGRISEPSVDEIVKRSKNPNNIKPELAIEWGTAGPDIDINEPAGEVKRNIPEEDLGDASEVIVFAREQMNAGVMGKALSGSLKARFDQNTLKKAKKGLKSLFAMEGVLGCFAVDARVPGGCKAAMEAGNQSPYKHFIKHIIGCSCGDHQMLPDTRPLQASMPKCSGNAIDDFFAVEQPAQPAMVAHCRSTLLPIMAGEDIDQSELDGSSVGLMDLAEVPDDTAESMWKNKHNDKYTNAQKLQAAFRAVCKAQEASEDAPYSQKVDASEFVVKQADNEIEFGAAPMGDLDVDPVDPGLQQEVIPDSPALTNFETPSGLDADMSDVELSGCPNLSQVDIELTDESIKDEIPMDELVVPDSQLVVDEHPAELEVEGPSAGPIDVEMTQFQEEEFEDTDIVDLDDKKTPSRELDISLSGELQYE